MFCPHCGHQNEPQTAQCAGCQRLFVVTPAGDAPLAAASAPSVKCVKCGYENAWDATQCHACLASLERTPDPALSAPAPPTPGKWLGAAVGVVAALIVVAQVIHLLAPAPSQPAATVPPAQAAAPGRTTTSLAAPGAPSIAGDDPAPELQFRLGMSYLRQRKPAQARETFQELLFKYPGSRFATDARAQLEQLGSGSGSTADTPLSPAAQPFGAGEDLGAELQYRVATNWMSKHEPAKARLAFEEVVRKYPGSSYAREARAKLAHLPVAAPQAPAQVIAKAAPPPKIGPPKNTITNEDFRRMGAKSAPVKSTAQRTEAAPPPPKPEGERTLPTLGDKLTLVSGDMVGDKLILTLRYQLALGRSRKVYAAARVVFPEPHSPVFAYSAETFQGSSGMVLVQVPVTAQTTLVRPVSVRLMMFEANGAMFYSQDMPWP